MTHYDAKQLQTMLEGATPLQSLAGSGGVMAAGMAELGVRDATPQMAAPAPDAGWTPVLRGPEL